MINNNYLDDSGYDLAMKRIDEINEELNNLTFIKSQIPVPGESEGYYSDALLEAQRKESQLLNEKKYLKLLILTAKKLEKHNLENLVDIGDIINIDMNFGNEIEEITFKLVGLYGDMNSDITEVSINSPLGRAVYNKEIGQTCDYLVDNKPVSVLIKSKQVKEKNSKKLVITNN